MLHGTWTIHVQSCFKRQMSSWSSGANFNGQSQSKWLFYNVLGTLPLCCISNSRRDILPITFNHPVDNTIFTGWKTWMCLLWCHTRSESVVYSAILLINENRRSKFTQFVLLRDMTLCLWAKINKTRGPGVRLRCCVSKVILDFWSPIVVLQTQW